MGYLLTHIFDSRCQKEQSQVISPRKTDTAIAETNEQRWIDKKSPEHYTLHSAPEGRAYTAPIV